MRLKASGIIVQLSAIVASAAIIAGASYGLSAKDKDDRRDNDDGDAYTIGLFGDMPYNALGKAQYPALLADINRSDVVFSVFDGDLKAGGDGPCSDSLYPTALDHFNSLRRPLIVVPGDNDWTDCWGRYGPATLPYSDPEERLNFERMLFFSTDRSLGQHTLKVTRQPTATRRTSDGSSGRSCSSASTCRARTTTIRITTPRPAPAYRFAAMPKFSGSGTRRWPARRRISSG